MREPARERFVTEEEGRAHAADEAEALREAAEGVEADQPAHGRTGDAGRLAAARDAELLFDQRLDGSHQPLEVGRSSAAAVASIDERRVLVDAPHRRSWGSPPR